MPILAYGLNFRTADIEIRERLAYPSDDLVRAVQEIHRDVPSLREVAVVSTCNRTELHCETDREAMAAIQRWLASDRGVPLDLLGRVCYAHWDLDAVRHAMRVGAGLDSLVLGEPQILGQLKDAYATARSCGTLGKRLDRLADSVWSAAKRARTQTNIGENPVSVASTAITLAQQIFEDLRTVSVLLIGSGQTIRRVALHLNQAGCRQVSIANRTKASAETLAHDIGGRALSLDQISEALHQFDVIISSTGSAAPVLFKNQVQQSLAKRKRRPVFIVDIAVPRDVEPAVAELRDIFLYSIDDLSKIIDKNLKNRELAADLATEIIENSVEEYRTAERISEANGLLARYRQQTDDTREELLQAAMARLQSGADPESVLERLSRDLTSKLIHRPTMIIRQASAKGDHRLLDLLEAIHTRD